MTQMTERNGLLASNRLCFNLTVLSTSNFAEICFKIPGGDAELIAVVSFEDLTHPAKFFVALVQKGIDRFLG
jgi:hypothetical protein